MSDITVINDSEQSSLVTNGLAKNGELYLKAAGSTDAGAIVAYDSGVWRTFANEAVSFSQQYALDFDNIDDDAKAASDLTLGQTDDWTVSFWFKSTYTAGVSTSDDTYLFNGAITRFRIIRETNGLCKFYFYDDGGLKVYHQDYTYTDPWANWNHAAVTSNGGTLKLYINGALAVDTVFGNQTVNTATATADTRIILNQWVYGRGTGGIYGRSMAYDEIAIFHSDLSSSMSAIYNSGVPTDLTSYNPVVWWRMEEGSGSTVADSGTDGSTRRDLTLFNSPTFTTDIPS